MRTSLVFSVLVPASILLGGCGGDVEGDTPDTGTSDTSIPGNDSSVANDSSIPPSDGSTSIDGSTSTDGGVVTDAGSGSTPGAVACGNTSCNVPAQACCVRFQFDGGADGGPGLTRSCTAPNACQGGVTTTCDEKADCPTQGQVCCLQQTPQGVRGTCSNGGCGPGGVQLCKTTGECTNDGGVCTVYTCPQVGAVQSCRKPAPQCN